MAQATHFADLIKKAVLQRRALPGCTNPVQSREIQKATVKMFTFRIAGVSFEGRQEVLKTLDKGAAVMLQREPDNAFDPNAIAVTTLDGTSLGYVPRDENQQEGYSTTPFGHICSVGLAAEAGLLGATVAFRPGLPLLVTEAIPSELEEACSHLPSQLGSHWQNIQEAAAYEASSRCQISGASNGEFVVSPIWQADSQRRTIKLEGAHHIAAQLHAAQQTLLKEEMPIETAWVFQAMNGWTLAEVEAFRRHQMKLARERSMQGFALDLKWLSQLGIPIPKSLQQLTC